MERRDLFTSFTKHFQEDTKKIHIIRPPYFLNESDFLKCIDCNTKDCKIACDEDTKIIKILDDGTPSLNFSVNGCTYCDDCAEACKEDILKVENKKNINTVFSIDLIKCLSWHQTMCFSCKEPCLVNAIEFLGMFRPEINVDICNSCGFCLNICPTNAIELKVKI
jgi:ferredoxin-type protein NapF